MLEAVCIRFQQQKGLGPDLEICEPHQGHLWPAVREHTSGGFVTIIYNII